MVCASAASLEPTSLLNSLDLFPRPHLCRAGDPRLDILALHPTPTARCLLRQGTSLAGMVCAVHELLPSIPSALMGGRMSVCSVRTPGSVAVRLYLCNAQVMASRAEKMRSAVLYTDLLCRYRQCDVVVQTASVAVGTMCRNSQALTQSYARSCSLCQIDRPSYTKSMWPLAIAP